VINEPAAHRRGGEMAAAHGTTEPLNAGRRRAREPYEKTQELNAGAQPPA
jgi:hypothetical protein